ncbi:hypothetical protein M1105_19980 [Limibaculum sp. FT325]|uniref:hypothetical protein n=1 Tax=Thermohalobaculum sediminis TaxID=2939436 RepID=UPI0020BD68D9|nr:hypothetical protein [Limibaculum sediminis]MCL5779244.1 hypothetical protein [Limibaculum sediminis]
MSLVNFETSIATGLTSRLQDLTTAKFGAGDLDQFKRGGACHWKMVSDECELVSVCRRAPDIRSR